MPSGVSTRVAELTYFNKTIRQMNTLSFVFVLWEKIGRLHCMKLFLSSFAPNVLKAAIWNVSPPEGFWPLEKALEWNSAAQDLSATCRINCFLPTEQRHWGRQRWSPVNSLSLSLSLSLSISPSSSYHGDSKSLSARHGWGAQVLMPFLSLIKRVDKPLPGSVSIKTQVTYSWLCSAAEISALSAAAALLPYPVVRLQNHIVSRECRGEKPSDRSAKYWKKKKLVP